VDVDRTVRPARREDAPALGAVQAAAWRRAYADTLPADVWEELSPEAFAAVWEHAVTAPPSARHQVLVAVGGSGSDEPGAGSPAPDPRVVGFAALAPAADEDLDADIDAELVALVLAPAAERQGHGSRLLNAAVELLRDEGSTHVYFWAARSDRALITFLEGAGWVADGARRTLDLRGDGEVVVDQARLGTRLSEEESP
jgi:GNAT superfamily N-acetyltransferase